MQSASILVPLGASPAWPRMEGYLVTALGTTVSMDASSIEDHLAPVTLDSAFRALEGASLGQPAQGLAETADASSAIDSAAPATMAPSFRDLGSSSMTAWHGHSALLSPVPAPDQLWSERTTTPAHEEVVGGTWLAVPVGAPTCAGTHIAPILCQKNEHWLARCPQVGLIEAALTSEISGESHVKVPAAKTGRRRGAQIAGRRTPDDTLEPNDKHVQYPRQLRRQPSRQYKRAISSATALRLLHIPMDMHRQLCLSDMYPRQAKGRRTSVCTVRLVLDKFHVNVVMFKTKSAKQHHRRFSTGWRDFCKMVGVEVGDTLEFERTKHGNELAVGVVKADSRH